ncbi:unnamed protein product [Closterium sp. Naga37s-1]|nr:unnamed protein product [Closterium sp. Naga37s-1]
MATLRSVFILALVLVSLPALYATSAPLRGDVAAGSAGVDAASWGRKLLEASSGADVDQQGGEEEVGEVTDGLDEAVRVLLSWKKIKNGIKNAASKAGGVAKKVVQKGGVEALKAAAKGYSNGGMKGALKAGGGSLARTGKTMVGDGEGMGGALCEGMKGAVKGGGGSPARTAATMV